MCITCGLAARMPWPCCAKSIDAGRLTTVEVAARRGRWLRNPEGGLLFMSGEETCKWKTITVQAAPSPDRLTYKLLCILALITVIGFGLRYLHLAKAAAACDTLTLRGEINPYTFLEAKDC